MGTVASPASASVALRIRSWSRSRRSETGDSMVGRPIWPMVKASDYCAEFVRRPVSPIK
jgi:hypothetical protein